MKHYVIFLWRWITISAALCWWELIASSLFKCSRSAASQKGGRMQKLMRSLDVTEQVWQRNRKPCLVLVLPIRRVGGGVYLFSSFFLAHLYLLNLQGRDHLNCIYWEKKWWVISNRELESQKTTEKIICFTELITAVTDQYSLGGNISIFLFLLFCHFKWSEKSKHNSKTLSSSKKNFCLAK